MIKKTGAILFSFLLIHAQVYALKGGPWDNIQNVYGTYSSILVPDADANLADLNEQIEAENNADDDPSNDTALLEKDPSANSLGLMVMVVTPQGFGGGFSVLFVEGFAMTGPVVALGDPDKGEIDGVIQNGVALITVITSGNPPVSTTVNYLGTANGIFKSKLIEGGNSLTSNLQRIKGTAFLSLNVSFNGEGSQINYIIDGYRSSQSTDVGSVDAPTFGNLSTN